MILLLIIALATSSFAQSADSAPFSVAVSSSLLTEQASIGDTAEAEVFILFDDNPEFWLFDSMAPPTATGLKFLGTVTQSETQTAGDSIFGRTNIKLRFSPTRTGQLTISPWKWRIFHIPNGDTTHIDTLDLNFKGFAITGLPKKSESAGALPFILILAGLALFLIAVIFIYRAVVRARKKPLEPSRPPTPAEKAIAGINRLSPHRMGAEELLDKLAKIVRRYISEEFNISAIGMSSDEILSVLSQHGLAGHRLVALKQMFKFCDDVRFAEKYYEAEEIREAIGQAIIFVGEK